MVQSVTGEFIMPNKSRSDNQSNIEDEVVNKIKELSKLRKEIALDLKHIASKTKISTNQLKNIESFKFEKLPPHPMRSAFINQYCSIIEQAQKK